MEKFKEDCKSSGRKYSPEVERILAVHNKNRLIYEGNTDRCKEVIRKEAKELISIGKGIIGELEG